MLIGWNIFKGLLKYFRYQILNCLIHKPRGSILINIMILQKTKPLTSENCAQTRLQCYPFIIARNEEAIIRTEEGTQTEVIIAPSELNRDIYTRLTHLPEEKLLNDFIDIIIIPNKFEKGVQVEEITQEEGIVSQGVCVQTLKDSQDFPISEKFYSEDKTESRALTEIVDGSTKEIYINKNLETKSSKNLFEYLDSGDFYVAPGYRPDKTVQIVPNRNKKKLNNKEVKPNITNIKKTKTKNTKLKQQNLEIQNLTGEATTLLEYLVKSNKQLDCTDTNKNIITKGDSKTGNQSEYTVTKELTGKEGELSQHLFDLSPQIFDTFFRKTKTAFNFFNNTEKIDYQVEKLPNKHIFQVTKVNNKKKLETTPKRIGKTYLESLNKNKNLKKNKKTNSPIRQVTNKIKTKREDLLTSCSLNKKKK